MNSKPTTKAEVREMIKDVREALRAAERALDANNWDEVVECLGYWASPSAADISFQIEETHNIVR
jgi:hypothetical protein